MSEVAWYALAVVPRKEKATAKALRLKGYEDFLPLYSERRRWSDRVQTVELPLFPGYVFCRLDARYRLPILKMDSVMSIIGLGNQPQPIPDAEINALQAVCRAGIHAIPCPYLTAGSKVTIGHGPLTGVEGILESAIQSAKDTRLILSVSLLQRSVSVEVDTEWIAPVRIYREF